VRSVIGLFRPAPATENTAGFRKVLRDHTPLMLKNGQYTTIKVEPAQADKWVGDLPGLLSELNVPSRLWWPTMIMNGLDVAWADIGSVRLLNVPSESVIQQLGMAYGAVR